MNQHQQAVYDRLLQLKDQLPLDHPIFGEIEDRVLCLPRDTQADSRKASWPKKFKALAKSLVNQPQDLVCHPPIRMEGVFIQYVQEADCWFFPATKEAGYHELKISADGSKGKYRTARLLHVLVEPDAFNVVNDREEAAKAIHRCKRGKAAGGAGEPACCNPYHVYFGPQVINLSTNGCIYGARWLCPHEVKCLCVHPDGRTKACLNGNPVSVCNHTPRKCW